MIVWNVVSSDAPKKDKVCLLKKMKLGLITLGHVFDPSIYRGKKYMEHIAAVNMTVRIGSTFKNPFDGHNLMG